MIQIALNLAYIYLRKFFVKGDLLAVSLLLGGILFSLFGIFQHYTDYFFLLFLFLWGTASHHLGRKDTELLRNYTNHRKILFTEYCIENILVLFVFLLKKDFSNLLIYLICIAIITFLPQKTSKTKYPFLIFDPQWHISFRKYRLILFFPLCLALIYIGYAYENQNLGIFSLILAAFICSLPYFERELSVHISISNYLGKDYLWKSLKIGFLNFVMFFTPIFLTFLIVFQEFTYFWVFPIFFTLPLVGILTKYAFFESTIMQSLVFFAVMSGILYGVPLVAIPLLYYKSVQSLKKIQYANYQH
ncbi:ABC transporter permease [Capnocytophaga felis]|uniref:ABC transporter permease n=1 Tax=Capnocytophaga felis TaxID=2267611 RepID=UPI0012D2E44F|nr:ABC transporter permease [Capnocytophaga felis]